MPSKNRNIQAKYTRYLHLNLLQKVISKAPNIPKNDNPTTTPYKDDITTVTSPKLLFIDPIPDVRLSSTPFSVYSKLLSVSSTSLNPVLKLPIPFLNYWAELEVDTTRSFVDLEILKVAPIDELEADFRPKIDGITEFMVDPPEINGP